MWVGSGSHPFLLPCDILPFVTCDDLVRMREAVSQLRSETNKKRLSARDAIARDRRACSRGGSDLVIFMERKLHRATAALEHHLATHGCQE